LHLTISLLYFLDYKPILVVGLIVMINTDIMGGDVFEPRISRPLVQKL